MCLCLCAQTLQAQIRMLDKNKVNKSTLEQELKEVSGQRVLSLPRPPRARLSHSRQRQVRACWDFTSPLFQLKAGEASPCPIDCCVQ